MTFHEWFQREIRQRMNEWKPKLTMRTDICSVTNIITWMSWKMKKKKKKTNEMLLKLWQTSVCERDIATMPSKNEKLSKSEMTLRLLCFLLFRNPKLYTKSIFPSQIYIWCSQSIFGCSRSLNFHASYRLNERTNATGFMNMKMNTHQHVICFLTAEFILICMPNENCPIYHWHAEHYSNNTHFSVDGIPSYKFGSLLCTRFLSVSSACVPLLLPFAAHMPTA